MGFWKQYALSIIVCSISCWILSQIISDTKRKELMHLICGTFLAVSILTPLRGFDPEEFVFIPKHNRHVADFYVSEGKETASAEREKCIITFCEAYILDKAKTLGAVITARISLNEMQVPVFAEIRGEPVDPEVHRKLQDILTTDLGIPKENQKWIWNQESNGS